MKINMNPSIDMLSNFAVDRRVLATNFAGTMPDCTQRDIEPRTAIFDRFPLVEWLMNTELTSQIREDIRANGPCLVQKGETGYTMKVPETFWTVTPTSSSSECCWAPMDFAKCGSEVPINLLCLKDCESIMDQLMGRQLINRNNVPGFASDGETMETIKRRVARMSMAFYTAYTIILGLDNTYTDILKPFHGLLQVMNNAAVTAIPGADILAAFKMVACRLAVMGYTGAYTFAVNPIIYRSILDVIVPGQFGELPRGWSRNGDEITFMGIGFTRDDRVPVDLEEGTGEIWVLDGRSIGLWLAGNLMPEGDFVRESGHQASAPADGCGSDCTYYYNFGAVANNNSNRIMKITDVAISNACASTIGDLATLIMPTTLVPRA